MLFNAKQCNIMLNRTDEFLKIIKKKRSDEGLPATFLLSKSKVKKTDFGKKTAELVSRQVSF